MRQRVLFSLLCTAALLVAGCGKKEPAPEPVPAPTPAAPPAEAQAPAAPASVAAAPVQAFDPQQIPVSTKPLGDWPYVTPPAGYVYRSADALPARTKDLARVAMWTGSEMVWVEGKTFEDSIRNAQGKTFSRFEVLKGVDKALTELGAVKLSERTFDEPTFKAQEKALEPFRQEFSEIRNAYWYDSDATTYALRTDHSLVWFVVWSDNSQGAIMVAEGPVPPAKSN